jgi:hypothetical protein
MGDGVLIHLVLPRRRGLRHDRIGHQRGTPRAKSSNVHALCRKAALRSDILDAFGNLRKGTLPRFPPIRCPSRLFFLDSPG